MTKKSKELLDPRQALFLEYYLKPQSPTFSNIYQSAIKAGYSDEYAQNMRVGELAWVTKRTQSKKGNHKKHYGRTCKITKQPDKRLIDTKARIRRWEEYSYKKYKNMTNNYDSWKYLYLLKCGDYYKIGYSNNVENRVNDLQCASAEHINIVFAIKLPNAQRIEKLLHVKYAKCRVNREWFVLKPGMVRQIVAIKDIQHGQ